MEQEVEKSEDTREEARRIRSLENQLASMKDDARREAADASEDDRPSFGYHDITGLRRGTIRDIDIQEQSFTADKVVFTVEFDDGERTEITCAKPRSYSDNSVIVRLLEWRGIENGEIGDLLKERVLVNVESSTFAVPKKLDTFGKASYYGELFVRYAGLMPTGIWRGEPLITVPMGLLIIYMFGIFPAIPAFIAASTLGAPVIVLQALYLFLPLVLGVACAATGRSLYAMYRVFQKRRRYDEYSWSG